MEKVDGIVVWAWEWLAAGEQTLEAFLQLHLLVSCDHQQRLAVDELPLRAGAPLAQFPRKYIDR